MAELAIKIDDGAGYEDGDVLCAFNRRRIRCVHAEHLCLPKVGNRLADMDGNGIMPAGHLSQDWMEATHEYRFERLSSTEAQVVRMADGETIRFESGVEFVGFDGRPQHMHIEECVRAKRRAQQFPVFGVYGREVWYGGRIDFSDKALDKMWKAIVDKAGKTDKDFPYWPAGSHDLKSHLFVSVDDFDDDEAEAMVRPVVDEKTAEKAMLKKRAVKATDWKAVAVAIGTTEAAVKSKTTIVDKRDAAPVKLAEVLTDKTKDK